MNRKSIVLLALMLLCAAANVKAQTCDGSEEHPFPIRSLKHLNSLAQRINTGGVFYFNPADSTYTTTETAFQLENMAQGSHFRMEADIIMNNANVAGCEGVKGAGWNEWIPMGSQEHPFDGVFDGGFHIISGMYVNQAGSETGFFGLTSNHAEIRNLGITKSYVAGGNSTGGLVGFALAGTIEKCFFSGTIEGYENYVGALVGQITSGTQISNCYTNAVVRAAGNQLGGLVGTVASASPACGLHNVYTATIVRGTSPYTGALIGEMMNTSTILDNAFCDDELVSLQGYTPNEYGDHVTVDLMINGWTPGDAFNAGGNHLLPYIEGFDASNPYIYLTLLPIQLEDGVTLSTFNNGSGEVTLGGGAEVQWRLVDGGAGLYELSGNTLTISGQSYVMLEVTKGGVARTYAIRFDRAPYLGTDLNPLPVSTQEDLTALRNGVNSGIPFKYKGVTLPLLAEGTYFYQTQDITMPSSNWESIGYDEGKPFKGNYDGRGKTISGFTSNTATNALFRYTDHATIKNLTISNVRSSIYASLIYSMKGGLVDNCHAEGSTVVKGGLIHITAEGADSCIIKNCTSRNNPSNAISPVGAIVNQISADTTVITNCHNYGNITGAGYMGGIVGLVTRGSNAPVTMRNCSNHGDIINTSRSWVFAGGMLGYAEGSSNVKIWYCHNTGTISCMGSAVGGLVGSAPSNGHVYYSYNLGDVIAGDDGNESSFTPGIRGIANMPCTGCFNAGNIYAKSPRLAYGVSNTTSTNCFNAGTITNYNYTAYCGLTDNSTNYSLGRLSGTVAEVKGKVFDKTRIPYYTSISVSGAEKTTSDMLGTNLESVLGSGWTYTPGMYPRINELKDLPISIALALPIHFSGADFIDSVSTDFDIAASLGVTWKVEGTSGATIDPVSGGLQHVHLPSNRTGGNIILAAVYEDSVYYRHTLRMAVAAPDTLTVDNLNDLQKLRDSINCGAAFSYKNTPVPVGGQGTIFKLTNDIELPSSWSVSIGTRDNPFRGTFDGNNNTISNLTQSNMRTAGLFGAVEGGTIKNLNVANVNISNVRSGAALCGVLLRGTIEYCTVSGELAFSNAESASRWFGGGIVGTADGFSTIKHCANYANTTATGYVYNGGIVCLCATNTKIDTCINGGTISGGISVAGISAHGGIVTGCINYGNVSGGSNTSNASGIANKVDADYINAATLVVRGCANSGQISIPSVGGDCYVAGVSTRATTTEGCYNAGSIKGGNAKYVAGVAATAATSTTTKCFNVGQVSGIGENVRAVMCGSIPDQKVWYYDYQMCTISDPNATALSASDMCGTALQSSLGNTFFSYALGMYPQIKGLENLSASRAISSPVFLNARDSVNLIDSNFTAGGSTYNVTWTTNDPGAIQISGYDMTVGNPGVPELYAAINDTIYKVIPTQVKMAAFIIKDATQLANFRDCINSGVAFYYNPIDSTYSASRMGNGILVPAYGAGITFQVANDINLENAAWTPIGGNSLATAFQGILDGGDHTISNFAPRYQAYTGLFGYVAYSVIKNLTLDNVTVSGSGQYLYVGALAGYINSTTLSDITIRNSTIASNNAYAGGIAGEIASSEVKDIHFEYNNVSGTSYIGGICGRMRGHNITNVSALKCTVSATSSDSEVGGICGYFTSVNVPAYVTYVKMDTCTVNGSQYAGGILGRCSRDGSSAVYIKNSQVCGGSVHGSHYVGGVCGSAYTVYVDRCLNSSNVSATGNRVGGVIGHHQSGSQTYLVNAGNVESSGNYVGGILGYDALDVGSIAISYSFNSGHIKGVNYVGGIKGIGSPVNGTVAQQCVNSGTIEGELYVGGIVGESRGSSIYNVNAGQVKGNSFVGGLAGLQSQSTYFTTNTFSNSYSCGQVSGGEHVGNIAGAFDEGTISNCYYDMQMSPNFHGIGETDEDTPGITTGKLTREMLGTALSLTADFTYEAGLYPRPTNLRDSVFAHVAAMPLVLADTATAYSIPGSSSCRLEPAHDYSVAWSRTQGNAVSQTSATKFQVESPGLATITARNGIYTKHIDLVIGLSREFPAVIKNYTQLSNFTACINSGNTFFYDTRDSSFHLIDPAQPTAFSIYPSGENFFFKLLFSPTFGIEPWAGPIGTSASPFLGDFNGDNHIITNLPKATKDTCGFFGVNGGEVYDLTIQEPDITVPGNETAHNTVGAVAGRNTGKIHNCHVINGTVAGGQNVGAIAGVNEGFIYSCHNSATVAGNNYVGGICGNNKYSVKTSFNIGDITAKATNNTYLGGVTGHTISTATLQDCYNAGSVTATGTASKFVGGVSGSVNTANFTNCYNVGEVTAPTAANTGAIAGECTVLNLQSLAFDNQMCTQTTAFSGTNNWATATSTRNLTGNALATLFGTDNWTYTDNLYPRLKCMDSLPASWASVASIYLSSEKINDVEHAFLVPNVSSHGIAWNISTDADALDASRMLISDTVSIIHCGHPKMVAAKGEEHKTVQLTIVYTASGIEKDTICGGDSYTWDKNQITYYASNVAVVNVIDPNNNCPYTYTLDLTVPEPLTLEVTAYEEKCVGANDGRLEATVTGGFDHYFYEWRNSSNAVVGRNATVTGCAPGEYTLVVKDTINPEQCELTATATVAAATPLVFTVDTVSAGCYNVSDGFFAISVDGGKLPYTLSWSRNGSNAGSVTLVKREEGYTVNDLPDGNYTIALADSNNCGTSYTRNIIQDGNAYVVTAYSEDKMYNGTAVERNKYSLTINGGTPIVLTSNHSYELANHDVLTAIVEDSECKEAGNYTNRVLECKVMRGSQDVTCFYNLQTNDGYVTIRPRNVVVTSLDSTKHYDASDAHFVLKRPEVEVSGDGFTAEDAARITYDFTSAGQTGGGISDNRFTINWNGVNQNNYNVTTVFGVLKLIENGILRVTALGMDRPYDGTTSTFGQTEGVSYVYTAYYVVTRENSTEVDTIYGLGPQYHLVVEMNDGNTITMKDTATVTNRVTAVHAYTGWGTADQSEVTSSFQRIDSSAWTNTLRITQRPVTLTSYSDTWVYDGEAHTKPGVTVTGDFVAGEVSDIRATGTITNAETVENDIAFTPESGFNADNYDITYEKGTLKVTRRPLLLNGVETVVDYNGTEQHTDAFTYGNLISGHTASGISYYAYGTQAGEYHNGAFSGTVSVMDASNNDVTANYVTEEHPATFWVRSSEKELHIASSSKTEMYNGTAVTSKTYTVTYGMVPVHPVGDDFHFRLSTGDTVVITPTDSAVSGIVDAGSYKNNFSWSLKPEANRGNYNDENIRLDTGIVTVSKRPVTLTSGSLTKTYDAQYIVYDTVIVGGAGFVEGQGAAFTFDNPHTWTTVGSHANTFSYALNTGTSPDNYDITPTNGTLRIDQATLLVKADNVTRRYGEPNSFTCAITGYQGGEDATTWNGTVGYTCAAGQFSPFGVYTITPDVSGLTSANYQFTTENGQLTVQKRQVTVNANPATVTYDGTLHNATTDPLTNITYDGLASGDSATVTLSYSRVAAGQTPATIQSISITHNGSDDVTNNYIANVGEAKLVINNKKLKLIVENESKTYDGTALEPSRYRVDATDTLAAGDVITTLHFTGSITDAGTMNTAAINEATFRINNVANGIEVWERYRSYDLVVEKGTLTVNAAGTLAITVPEDTTKVYDGTPLTPSAATADGAVNSQPIAITYSTDGGATWTDALPSRTDAGRTSVMVKASAPNHTDATASYSLRVDKREITLTAKSKDCVVHDGNSHSYTELESPYYNITAGTLAEGQTIASAAVSGAGSTVGPHTITIGDVVINDAGNHDVTSNYNVTKNTGSLTIIANPAITADQEICHGSNATIAVTVDGGRTPITYAWADDNSVTTALRTVTPSATTTYTVTTTDANGCTVSKSTTVTVNTNPQIEIAAISGNVCPNGTKEVSAAITAGTGTYNSSSIVWSANVTDADLNGTTATGRIATGTNCNTTIEYTVTITDSKNCSATDTKSFVVKDTENPVIEGTIAATTVTGCSVSDAPAAKTTVAELELMGLTISDNCTSDNGLRVTHSDEATGTCPIVLTRTYTVTDSCNLSATATHKITIQRADFTMPANADSTVACASEITTPTPPTVTDNCGNTLTPAGPAVSATPDCNGNVTYTYTYTDCAGHSHDWVYTYTIARTAHPAEVGGPVATTAGVECATAANAPTTLPVVKDACGNVLSPVGEPVVGGTYTNCSGTKTFTYTYKDCADLDYTWTYTYTINDVTVPTFTAPDATTIYTAADCSYNADPAVTGTVTDAADNCAVAANLTIAYTDAVADGACAGSKVITRTWKVTDECDNYTEHTQVITVQDTTAPALTGTWPSDRSGINSCFGNRPAFPTNDSIKGLYADVCSEVTVTSEDGSITNDNCGWSITRTYTIKDACDNSITKTLTFSGSDQTNPTIAAGYTTNYNAVVSNCVFTYPDVRENVRQFADDNCTAQAALTITQSPAAGAVITQTDDVQDLTITVTVTDACGKFASVSDIHVSVPASLKAAITDDHEICEGESTSLAVTPSDGTAGYTYAWADDNSVTTALRTVTPSATTTYTVTATDANGCTVSKSTTVTMKDTVELTVPTNATQTLCLGNAMEEISFPFSNATLSITPAVPAGVTFDAANGKLTGEISTTTPYHYTVTATSNTGCTATDKYFTGTITMKDTVELTSTGTLSQELCPGETLETINFTFANATLSQTGNLPTGVGYSEGTGTATISGTPTSVGNYTYTVKATSNNECTAFNKEITVSITVKDTVVLTAGIDTTQTLCHGETLTNIVFNVEHATISMTSGSLPTGVTFNATTKTISGTPTQVGTFHYTVTAATDNGCDAFNKSITGTVVVKDTVELTSTGTLSQELCPGETLETINFTFANATLSQTGNLPTGVGYSEGTGTATISGTPTSVGNYTYTVKATSNNECTAFNKEITVSITVKDTVVLTAGTDTTQTLCHGETLTNIVFNVEHATISMTSGSLPTGVTFNATTKTISGTPTQVGTFRYTVTAATDNGCDAFNKSITGTIVVKDTVKLTSTGTLSQELCPGETLETINFTFANATLSQTGNLPTGVGYSEGTGTATISGTPTSVGNYTYTVKATSNNECTAFNKEITVSITVKDTVVLTAGNDTTQTLCHGETLTSIVFNVEHATLSMTSGSLPTGVTFNATTKTISGTPTQVGTFRYTVTAATDNGCDAFNKSITGTIVVKDTVKLTSTGTLSQELCPGEALETINFTFANATLSQTGNLPTGVGYSEGTGTATISGTPTSVGNYTYTVKATSNNECTAFNKEITVSITVKDTVVLTAGTDTTQTLCHGETLTNIVFNVEHATLSMTGGSLPTGVTFNATTKTISGTPTQVGTFHYTVTAATDNGCSTFNKSITGTIVVKDTVKLTATADTTQTLCSETNLTDITITFANADLSITGDLPTGVTFNATAGTITGTPTVAGTFRYTIKATSNTGCDAYNKQFTGTITVKPIATDIPDYADSIFCNGTAFSIAPAGNIPTGTTYDWTVAAAHTNAAGATAQTVISQTLTTTATAKENVVYHVTPMTDGCTGHSFDVTVTVYPTNVITLTCPADISQTLNYGECGNTFATIGEPTVSYSNSIYTEHNWNVTVSNNAPASLHFNEGTTTVTWTVTDECGNEQSCDQQVVVNYPPCGAGSTMATLTDASGNTYPTVRVGCDCWMGENLRTQLYVPITRAANDVPYREYNDNDSIADIYGYLYSWYAAVRIDEGDDSADNIVYVNGRVRGVCPDGWAIPTDIEYIQMVAASGDAYQTKSPSTDHWVNGQEGHLPGSGFNARGAGSYLPSSHHYESLMTAARFWTIPEDPALTVGSTATFVEIGQCESEECLRAAKGTGHSVRCIKVQ